VGKKYTQLSEHETWDRGRQIIGMHRAQREIKLRQRGGGGRGGGGG